MISLGAFFCGAGGAQGGAAASETGDLNYVLTAPPPIVIIAGN